jgi:hypothetical protein
VTLIVHFCCEFFAINMDAPLLICTKEEQRAVILFLWAEGVPCAKMFGRMSVRYRNSGLSTNGLRGSRMVAQALIMRKKPDAHPCPLLMQTQNKSVTWSCRIDGWLFMKWHINCKLVLVQPMKLSTTGLPSIKPVHYGSQNNSQNCTKRNVWTSANSFWIAMVLQVTASWKESSWEMKRGSTILSQTVNARPNA